MPHRKTGEHHVLLRMPDETFQRVKALSAAEYRSINQQLLLIIDTFFPKKSAAQEVAAKTEEV